MKFILFFIFSVTLFAQDTLSISLDEVQITSYSNYETFRPKFNKIERLTDHTNGGMMLLSNLHLPKKKEIEIVAIEFLFESKGKNKNFCNEIYYFKPVISKKGNESQNLLNDKWFLVDKNYNGKYVFPVNFTIESSDKNNYLIGIESSYDNLFCAEANGYFDLIKTKKKSDVFIQFKNQKNSILAKQELFGNYSLNYILYYK
ncbi:hypothetical protein SAMN05443634_101227 [Chishuiella changwenlii]|uniref:Uncharacterized protein n=1 Tax=Chishuiella changwenlii TaxID=1434701 RepID=A0A1M6T269_9FLAO|nr:hypothetical protein [Chishuiella changwenlii]GGE94646.1 hypothetical protein GCM10010984_10240 [Chishuiella changwenlii]SHK51055.1 hypothetical protein SAMN05443634_101227 [Chishuiella changwenlii]